MAPISRPWAPLAYSLVSFGLLGCPGEPRIANMSFLCRRQHRFIEIWWILAGGGAKVGNLWRPVARESGPYKKILARFGSILPGLLDAWVLLGCLG